jgi:hypothetical protein
MVQQSATSLVELPADDRFAVPSGRLRDHLLHEHGRTEREIDRLPLADLHSFEHIEQGMGLNDLGHRHQAPRAR